MRLKGLSDSAKARFGLNYLLSIIIDINLLWASAVRGFLIGSWSVPVSWDQFQLFRKFTAKGGRRRLTGQEVAKKLKSSAKEVAKTNSYIRKS